MKVVPGALVKIRFKGSEDVHEYRVEDKWDIVSGGTTWSQSAGWGNWAAKNYADRVFGAGLPADDDVWYGKIGGLGYLVHSSEILEEATV